MPHEWPHSWWTFPNHCWKLLVQPIQQSFGGLTKTGKKTEHKPCPAQAPQRRPSSCAPSRRASGKASRVCCRNSAGCCEGIISILVVHFWLDGDVGCFFEAPTIWDASAVPNIDLVDQKNHRPLLVDRCSLCWPLPEQNIKSKSWRSEGFWRTLGVNLQVKVYKTFPVLFCNGDRKEKCIWSL